MLLQDNKQIIDYLNNDTIEYNLVREANVDTGGGGQAVGAAEEVEEPEAQVEQR